LKPPLSPLSIIFIYLYLQATPRDPEFPAAHAMSHSDPKLLFSIASINAYHIQDGVEECLTPSGPQTLSLLMVPTSSPFAGLSSADPQSEAAEEEDFYLHLHLPPELDLPLPATTQIYHQPPASYLIPRWDLGPGSGAFTRIEFPDLRKGKCSQEDVDTFETIIAQFTAFLERAPPPKSTSRHRSEKNGKGPLPAYNPADFAPGEGYVGGSASSNFGGQIVLVDEEDGSVFGELGEGFCIVEDKKLKAGSKGVNDFQNRGWKFMALIKYLQILSRFLFRKMDLKISMLHQHLLNILKRPCTLPIKIPHWSPERQLPRGL
jgi:hypothetical protein